jgi:large subunit ribosomal protein L30e
MSAHKYKSGTKEVLQSVKGSKLIILSNSIDSKNRSHLEELAKSSNVPLYQFNGNSLKLGKLCNKPFRISVIALKSGTDEAINSIFSDKEKKT